jgi:hypothetical protein
VKEKIVGMVSSACSSSQTCFAAQRKKAMDTSKLLRHCIYTCGKALGRAAEAITTAVDPQPSPIVLKSSCMKQH